MTDFDWESAYADGHVPTPRDPHLLELAPTLVAGTALDLGCGVGQNSIWLAERGWSVTGLDISPSAIAAAQEAAGPDLEARFLVADLTEWTTTDGFDLVISTYALPSRGPGRDHALSVAASAVAPGGTILVTEFDVSMEPDHAWNKADLVTVEEISSHLDGFDVTVARVEVTPHAHGHDEHDYPVAVVIATRT